MLVVAVRVSTCSLKYCRHRYCSISSISHVLRTILLDFLPLSIPFLLVYSMLKLFIYNHCLPRNLKDLPSQ